MALNKELVLGGFLAVGLILAAGVYMAGENPQFARDIPSPLIGKPAPAFDLPQLHNPEARLSTAGLKGQVWVLNVWASWCVGCRTEHRSVTELARRTDVPVVGLNYKDEPDDAKGWLGRLGDPYDVVADDRSGDVGIDWGVYGVPETFVIDAAGVVRHKHIGPINDEAVSETLLPLLARLQQEAKG